MKRFSWLRDQRLFLVMTLLLLFTVAAQVAHADGQAPPTPNDLGGTPGGSGTEIGGVPGSGNGSGGGPGGHETDGDPDDYGIWVPFIVTIIMTSYYLFCR